MPQPFRSTRKHRALAALLRATFAVCCGATAVANLSACAGSTVDSPLFNFGGPKFATTAGENLRLAEIEFAEEDWDDAVSYADFVRLRFPFSRFSAEAELLAARANYGAKNYTTARDSFRQFARLHPTHKHVKNGWIDYMAAVCTFEAVPEGNWPLPPDSQLDRSALEESYDQIINFFARHSGSPVEVYAKELRERIEKGEAAVVFASANTEHPQRLVEAGGWAPHQVFVRNSLCALTSDRVTATPQNLLEVLLDPATRVGTSTPKADPSGDYAWALFRKADAVKPGAYATLDAKALQLTGGPTSPKAPAGRGTYAWVMDEGQADVFLTYCTNAVAARQEVPRLKVVSVPPGLQVGAAYGVTVRQGAPASAQAFAQMLLAPWAQAIFARYGFDQP